MPGRFIFGKELWYLFYKRCMGVWSSEADPKGAENLALTGVRTPDRPYSIESLYRIRVY
jgi:hypothetical protein